MTRCPKLKETGNVRQGLKVIYRSYLKLKVARGFFPFVFILIRHDRTILLKKSSKLCIKSIIILGSKKDVGIIESIKSDFTTESVTIFPFSKLNFGGNLVRSLTEALKGLSLGVVGCCSVHDYIERFFKQSLKIKLIRVERVE